MEVLYPFCYPSLFPPLPAAKNFSDLFQIFIFLAVALCWRDKLFSPASLALRRTCLNIYFKKNHFYLKPLIFPRISFKGMSQNPLRWRMSVPVRADEKENRRFAETQDNFCSEVCEQSSRIDFVCSPASLGWNLWPWEWRWWRKERGRREGKTFPFYSRIACTAPWALLLLCNLCCVLLALPNLGDKTKKISLNPSGCFSLVPLLLKGWDLEEMNP